MRWRRCSIATIRASLASGSPTSTAAGKISGRSPSLRQLNESVYREHPDVQMIAEESTAWPHGLTPDRQSADWGSGSSGTWAGCTTRSRILARDPIYRSHHHGELTFRRRIRMVTRTSCYRLSHDEVVHGKGSLYTKMCGDRLAEVRRPPVALRLPVRPARQEADVHGRRVRAEGRVEPRRRTPLELARTTRSPAAARLGHRSQSSVSQPARRCTLSTATPPGSSGSKPATRDNSMVAFMRHGVGSVPVLVVANFTPVPRHDYRIGVPRRGGWREVLNSDAEEYGGSGVGNLGRVVGRLCSMARLRPVDRVGSSTTRRAVSATRLGDWI